MQRQRSQPRYLREIFVKCEYTRGMLDGNGGNKRIDRGKANPFSSSQPEDRRRFTVSAKTLWVQHGPLRKVSFDFWRIPRDALQDFRNHYAGQGKGFRSCNHPLQLESPTPV